MTLIQEIKNNNIKDVSLIASKSTVGTIHSASISSIIQGKTESFIIIHNELKSRNPPKSYYQNHLENSLLKSVHKNKVDILNFLLEESHSLTEEALINLLLNSNKNYKITKALVEKHKYNTYNYYTLLAKIHSIYHNSNKETNSSYLKKINLIKSKISFDSKDFFDILVKDNWLVSMNYESLNFDFYHFLTKHCPDQYIFSKFELFEGHLSSFTKPKYRKMKELYSVQKKVRNF